jgi:cytoskeletal protein CcmA (bactofilin family)
MCSPAASRGGALIYVIASIVLLGTLGGGVAYFSSSSSVSQLANTRAEQAYYAALSGSDYVKQRHEALRTSSATLDALLADLGNNSGIYTLDSNRRFALATTKIDATHYSVAVTGSYLDAGGGATENSVIDMGSREYVPVGGGGSGSTETHRKIPVVTNGATIDGGVYADTVTLGNESTVKGDVVSTTWVVIGNKAAVTGDVCAGGDVTMHNLSSVGGDINTPGSVYIGSNNAVVEGSVYAGGDVTIQNGAKVMGDVNAGGYVSIGANNGSVYGSVYAAGNVTLGNAARVYANVHSGGMIDVQWGGTIDGDAIAAGTVSVNAWGGKVSGSVVQNASSPPRVKPAAPTACDVVTAPPLQSYSAGTTDIAVNYNNSKDISPGSYGKLTAAGKNVITLHAGTYYFSSMNLAWDCNWRLDVSGGDIIIFAVGDVSFGGEAAITVSSDGANYQSMWSVDPNLAAKVYLETHGSFSSGQNGRWFGTILAKNNITFSGGAESGTKAKVIGLLATVDGKITLSDKFTNILIASNFAKAHW